MPEGAQQTMKTATVMDMMKAERRSFFSSSLILRSDASLTRVSGLAQIWHSNRVEVAPFVSAGIKEKSPHFDFSSLINKARCKSAERRQ